MSEKFKKITFNQANGYLTVHTNTGTLYNSSIINNPIWLKVLDDWYIEINEISGSPDYSIKVPFGDTSNMGEIKFGKPITTSALQLQEENSTGTTHSITIGDEGAFYLGFIGTDDLRNGFANASGLNMHQMGVYLYIKDTGTGDYILEVGYKEAV